MMRNYQRWMGGVAIHDQLRRQRYSLHMAMVFRKYYKTIFLGLVDMAIVNAYTVYRETQKRNGRPSAGHAEFLRVLQAQMLELSAADFADQVMLVFILISYALHYHGALLFYLDAVARATGAWRKGAGCAL
ncbi:hypothetical protein PC116_g27148 [Phytophthora cactorum]|nr:hypothetical protein PC116_g27148 [Phytophthora cactorum]